MVESLEIDPFDSNHWLYVTGESIFGGHDLLKWPYVHVSSLTDGIEEESVQALICPAGGAPLLSAVGDDGGFRHSSLTTSPHDTFENPQYATTPDIDYAGLKPLNIVRIGNDGTTTNNQMALSTDGGASWNPASVSSTSIYGGHVAYSADASSIVWVTASEGNLHFANGIQSPITGLPTGVRIAADKANAHYFYAGDSSSFYVSSDGGTTFSITANIPNNGANSIKVHPAVAGDVWFSTTNGLYHSTNFGKTFTKIASVTEAYAIAIGKGTGNTPNLFGFVTTTSGKGGAPLSLSRDLGKTWTQISDTAHGFGSSSANCLAASWDVVGEVFVGTNGRGIFYGRG